MTAASRQCMRCWLASAALQQRVVGVRQQQQGLRMAHQGPAHRLLHAQLLLQRLLHLVSLMLDQAM